MNNEFKKIKNKHETRYVLETATASAISSDAIATSTSKIGELRRRLQELKDKISVPKSKPKSKPRNPVGMGTTQGRGTKKHRDSSRQRSRDEKKLSVDENNEMDHEISMASNELKSIAKDAVNLLMIVKQKSEEEGLQAWQQSKITKAADFMNSVLQSVSGDADQGVAEASLKQRAKTALRKLDPTIKGRLKDRADDEFDFGLEKDSGDWISGAPASAHMKHATHLRRLAKGEKPFQDKPRSKGVAEGSYTTEKQILTRIRQIRRDRQLSGTESNAGELFRLKQQLKDLRSQQGVAEGYGALADLEKKFQELLDIYLAKQAAGETTTTQEKAIKLLQSLIQSENQGVAEDNMHNEFGAVSINGKNVDISTIEIDGVDPRDRPDFADAYFSYADFEDGTPLSDDELDQLTDENGDLVNQMAHNRMYESVSESDNSQEYNDEAGMVKNNIHTILRVMSHLEKAIQENENIPEWCQEKIAEAKYVLVNVMDYMISQHEIGIQPDVQDQDVVEAHGNSKIYDKCWTGFRKVPGKKRGEDDSCKKIKKEDTYVSKLQGMLEQLKKN